WRWLREAAGAGVASGVRACPLDHPACYATAWILGTRPGEPAPAALTAWTHSAGGGFHPAAGLWHAIPQGPRALPAGRFPAAEREAGLAVDHATPPRFHWSPCAGGTG